MIIVTIIITISAAGKPRHATSAGEEGTKNLNVRPKTGLRAKKH